MAIKNDILYKIGDGMDLSGREILLVEDNPADAELTIDALYSKDLNKKIKLLNELHDEYNKLCKEYPKTKHKKIITP